MPADDQVFYGTSGSSLSEGFVSPTEYTYPCIFVFEPHPLGYRPAELFLSSYPFSPDLSDSKRPGTPGGDAAHFFPMGFRLLFRVCSGISSIGRQRAVPLG